MNEARYRISILALLLVALLSTTLFQGLFLSTRANSQARKKWQMREKSAITIDRMAQNRLSLSTGVKFLAADKSSRYRTLDTTTHYNQISTIGQGTDRYQVVNAEFDSSKSCSRFNVSGVKVFTRFDRFADMFVPVDQGWETLRPFERWKRVHEVIGGAAGLVWFDLSTVAEVPPPPKVTVKPKARGGLIPEQIIRGGINGLTGKGVIIAIVDSGVDFRNPDFITYDLAGRPTSRLLYLWDTTSKVFDERRLGSKPPISYPNGASVGTLYTREQLTAELRSKSVLIPPTDLGGHGTACAGVAAGNGNNGGGRRHTIGVAPEADIIAVCISKSKRYLENSFLLGAICGWLDSVAGADPLVVSCRFGGQRGGRDGSFVMERQLNARFPLSAKGRSLVIAAGNEADMGIHAETTFKNKSEPGLITFSSLKSSQPVLFDIYFDNDDIEDLLITPADQTDMAILEGNINPFNGHPSISLGTLASEGGFYLYTKSGREVKADVYIHGGLFSDDCVSYSKQISSPGTTENAITVGSYIWNNQFETKGRAISVGEVCETNASLIIGYISCYSNPGYSRSGAIKPEIVAPGEVFHASYAKLSGGRGVDPSFTISDVNGYKYSGIDASGNYRLFNGTSAATPYVAGVLALVMQKRPTITLGEIRALLARHATGDKFTNEVPNIDWGYGKLDMAAIKRILTAID
jgi:subtilisin family serine protease